VPKNIHLNGFSFELHYPPHIVPHAHKPSLDLGANALRNPARWTPQMALLTITNGESNA
jgi:hypothetical protein